HGEGVPEDKNQAAFWYRKAADQGDGWAQFKLATMYKHRDPEQAVSWFRKSLDQGNLSAQLCLFLDDYLAELMRLRVASAEYRLAHDAYYQPSDRGLYKSGKASIQEVLNQYNRNFIEAAFWYRKAADQGDGWAQFKLSQMYLHGSGVPQSDEQAD